MTLHAIRGRAISQWLVDEAEKHRDARAAALVFVDANGELNLQHFDPSHESNTLLIAGIYMLAQTLTNRVLDDGEVRK